MKDLFSMLWKEFKPQEKEMIKITILYSFVTYCILQLYVPNFNNLDIWTRLINSVATTSFASVICTAMWSIYEISSHRYAAFTSLTYSITIITCLFFYAVGIHHPWTPALVFLGVIVLAFLTLYHHEKKAHKNKDKAAPQQQTEA